MSIHIHVERLILDGLPVTKLQGPQVRAALEQELARLLTAHGLSNELRVGGAVPRVRAGAIQIGKDSRPARLGQSIAHAVHEGIGNQNRGKTR
jgi:hypothetical protein